MANCSKRPISITDLATVLQDYITKKDFYNNYAISQVTHSELLQLKEESKLVPSRIYLITDYQTIYQDPTTKVVRGVTGAPIYKILVQAVSSNILDPNVLIVDTTLTDDIDINCIKWEVKYDITPKTYGDIKTKGTIYYLKDEHNNSAYFDFKSIVFEVTQEEQNKYNISGLYPAFSNECSNITIKDCPNLKRVILRNQDSNNVTIEENCSNVIFLGSTDDITVHRNCSDIAVLCPIKNIEIYQNISGLTVTRSQNGALLNSNTPKTIYPSNGNFVLSYFDTETLTDQCLTL